MKMSGIPFGTTDWSKLAPTEHKGERGCAYWRTQNFGAVRVRMVEYTAGYLADHWLELFAASASPGTTDSIAPGFVAWGLQRGEPHPDPEELITQRRVPFSAAVAMSISGEIADLASIAAILSIEARFRRGELPSDLASFLASS